MLKKQTWNIYLSGMLLIVRKAGYHTSTPCKLNFIKIVFNMLRLVLAEKVYFPCINF